MLRGEEHDHPAATRIPPSVQMLSGGGQRVAPTCFSVMKGFKMTYILNFFLLQI
jgi:hypothetical protein